MASNYLRTEVYFVDGGAEFRSWLNDLNGAMKTGPYFRFPKLTQVIECHSGEVFANEV